MARILKKGNDVFYNEAQVTNRDLSVAVLRRFLPQLAQEKADGKIRKPGQAQKDKKAKKDAKAKDQPAQPAQGNARLLEGLAASGLRSIRYALELDGVSRIDATDLDPAVVDSMRANIALNGPEAQARVVPTCSDARLLMLQSPEAYDAIDLDPYGTPAHFLDSALQAVAEGGLLAVTATDMAVLCGNSGEVCWTKYGSYPIHRPYCHEAAVRILLSCLESHANRYKRYIVPLLSVHMDFYIRVFVRVFTSAAEIKCSASKQAYVWQSQGCDSWWLQPVGQQQQKGNSVKHMPAHGPAVPQNRCPESGAAFLMGGPIWARPLHDQVWVAELLQQMEAEAGRYAQFARLKGILTSVLEELPDVPLYYNVHDMCRTVRCTPPRAEQLRSAIINAGFRVSGSHANPLALKTDAPPKVVWDIVRCWVKMHPIKPPQPGTYPAVILSKEVETEADFRKAAGAVPESVKAGVKRFVQNPAFWGPKARHGRPLKPEQQKQQLAQAEQRRTQQQQQQQQQDQGAAAAGGSGSSGGAAAGGSSGTAAAAAAAAAQEAAAGRHQGEAAAAAASDGDDLLSMLYDKEDEETQRPPKKARNMPAAEAAAAAGTS
ncbi:N2,N2-dimethylguanosine tRNA methyltransferase-domain-containing protein [Scenedesmus sp. NREL 46B-D3]|nr:N2,N2-dimethylguanosine tRNA methyltransferase-domain-containing protein [Scenedesmus sp. NREL 46B-D3]